MCLVVSLGDDDDNDDDGFTVMYIPTSCSRSSLPLLTMRTQDESSVYYMCALKPGKHHTPPTMRITFNVYVCVCVYYTLGAATCLHRLDQKSTGNEVEVDGGRKGHMNMRARKKRSQPRSTIIYWFSPIFRCTLVGCLY